MHEKYSPLIFVYVFWLPNNFMRYVRVFLCKFMLLPGGKASRTCRRLSVKHVCFNLSRPKNHWKMQFISKTARYMLGS